ncbi:MAG: MBL fold metallo-hydrolase [Dehalococcoidia bacterium]
MGEVTVRFLGSGDAFGSGGRFQTCMLVTSSEGSTLIDCGASSLIAMKRFGVDPSVIDTVLVSHLHGDHFGGLPFLILDGQFSRRTRALTIAGPPGVEARVHAAMEVLFPGSSQTQQRYKLRFVELTVEVQTLIGSVGVMAFPAEHASGAPSFALRVVVDGRVIAYTGDTAWTDALIRAADGADLLICEAYYFDKRVPFHLDYQSLMEHRASLRCRHLILTHMQADMLGHIDTVSDECASDGLELVL